MGLRRDRIGRGADVKLAHRTPHSRPRVKLDRISAPAFCFFLLLRCRKSDDDRLAYQSWECSFSFGGSSKTANDYQRLKVQEIRLANKVVFAVAQPKAGAV